MFNFSNFEAEDFEKLVKDIIEKNLKISLRTYTKGRDGGIDVRGFEGNDVIVQAKLYTKSNYSSLKAAIKKEIEKIKELEEKPMRYILAVACQLTPKQEEEIYCIGNGLIKSKEDIYDAIRLNDFLEKSENREIVEKNNKLWLIATNILNIIINNNMTIDLKAHMEEFNDKKKFLVETKAYRESLRILERKNILILYGEPGVGKTTLSTMLLEYYYNKEYSMRYSSDNDIKDIKNMLLDNTKEIILLDDFLGQHYMKFDENIGKRLKYLILKVSKSSEKKLILNSRITILNEVLNTNQKLREYIEVKDYNKYLISSKDISFLDKGRILYKYMYFNEIPKEYFNEIKKEKRYLSIIKHKNFNLRIIEYITKKDRVIKKECSEYFKFILKILNNPEEIWKEEFEMFATVDRILINTLYSLTSTTCDKENLKKCFEERLRLEDREDTTLNLYDKCIKRLDGSVIRMEYELIRIINPSVNDYIYNYLKGCDLEVEKILKCARFVEQLENMRKINDKITKEFIIKLILEEKFLSLQGEIDYYYLLYISEFNIQNENLTKDIHKRILRREGFRDKEKGAKLIIDFFGNEEIFKYYKLNIMLEKITKDKSIFIFYEYLDIDKLKKIIPLHEIFMKKNRDFMISKKDILMIDRLILWEIEIDVKNKIDYELDRILIEEINNIDEENNIEIESKIKSIEKKLSIRIDTLIKERKKILKGYTILGKNLDNLESDYEGIWDEIQPRERILSYIFNNELKKINEDELRSIFYEKEIVEIFEKD